MGSKVHYVIPPELAQRRAHAAALYENGYTYQEIARCIGVGLRTVFRDLTRSGVNARPRWQMKPRITERNRAIAAAYARGDSLKRVGDRFGISEQVAGYHVRRVRQAR